MALTCFVACVVSAVVGGFAMHLMDNQPVAQAALNTIMVPVKWVVGFAKSAVAAVVGLFTPK
jgi:hypothetical protein